MPAEPRRLARRPRPLQQVARPFCAELQPFTAGRLHAVGLRSDGARQNLDLALVAERERGADRDHHQAIPAFRYLLF